MSLPIEASRETPAFAPWTTMLFAIAWALVMIQGWGGLILGDPDRWLRDPVSAASRIAVRELELSEAAQASEGLTAWIRDWLHDDVAESRAYAIEIFQDIVIDADLLSAADGTRLADLDRARVQLAVLLAEDSQIDAAVAVAEEIPEGDEFVAFLKVLYEGKGIDEAGVDAAGPLEMLAGAGVEGWLLERPAVRLLASAGRTTEARALENELVLRGRRWLLGSEFLFFANWLLILVGAVIVIGESITRRRNVTSWLRQSNSAPWSLADGLGVLIRGDFWGRAYFVVLGHTSLEFQISPIGDSLYVWGTPLSSIPLIWLTLRHLIRPHSVGALDCFGLRPRGWEPTTLSAVFLSAVALDLLGTWGLSWGVAELGFQDHWAEGFDESLVWGPFSEVARSGLDYLVWAPIFEEFAFRGLLYFTLRRRFDPWSAAIASAGLFGIVHFYSFPGFISTFWSGFVWALAFERTRSLVPGIAAHSVYNLFYVAGLLLVYR